jgi:photosystem II stability/assembly factor-like uncharacterized protein
MIIFYRLMITFPEIDSKTIQFLMFAGLFWVFLIQGCSSPVDLNEVDEIEIDGYRWTFLGLEGKWVTSVEDTPWGLFAGTQENGVFRYDESRNTWLSLGLDHAIISEIVYALTDEPMVLVGVTCCRVDQVPSTPAAIFASNDGGNTWLEWDGGIARENDENFWASSLMVDSKNPYRMYFGKSTFQLLLSEDGGRSWDYVSGDRNTWGGETLTITLSSKRDGRIWFGGYNAFGYPHVYSSDDWGRHAETIYFERYEGWISKILTDNQNPSRIWMAQSDKIKLSVDGGDNWESLLHPDEIVYFYGLLLSDTYLYAAGALWQPQSPHEKFKMRFYVSNDNGISWNRLSSPENAIGASDLKIDRENRMLLPTFNGLWRVEKIW